MSNLKLAGYMEDENPIFPKGAYQKRKESAEDWKVEPLEASRDFREQVQRCLDGGIVTKI